MVVAQPIYEVQPEGLRPFALECLTRGPRGTNIESPEILLEYARRIKQEVTLDRARTEAILNMASYFPDTNEIWMCIQDATITGEKDYAEKLAQDAGARGIMPSQITLDIEEHASLWNELCFIETIRKLRASGIKIALSDPVAGIPSFRMLNACPADYVRIGRYFVGGCHKSYNQRTIIESVINLTAKFGMKMEAHSIEHMRDLETLKALGIKLVQGYLLSPALPSLQLMHEKMTQTGFYELGTPTR